MKTREHTLEFLLDSDGRRHWYEGGYFAKFAIRRVKATKDKPHGLRYSFAACAGRHLAGGRSGTSLPAQGCRLIDDFFDEVERVLAQRGVPFDVIADDHED